MVCHLTLPPARLLRRHFGLDVDLMQRRLSHENLIVYQSAIQFLALAIRIIGQFPKGNAAKDKAEKLEGTWTVVSDGGFRKG